MSFSKGVLGCLAVLLVSSVCAAQQPGPAEVEDIVIGHRIEIYSDVLNEARSLEIYLPDDYEESDNRYPVLLAVDGGWFFRYCISIIDMMSPNHLPEMIVVGLPNTDRRRDLDPANPNHPEPLGGTVMFRRFLAEELLPYLDRTYRTHPYRVLSGHSLAGYFTVYSLFADPELFDAFIATSPSLGREERRAVIHSFADTVRASLTEGKVLYFSVGGKEPERIQDGIQDLAALCKERSGLGIDYSWEVFDGEGHVPVKGFYQGIRLVFSGWFPAMEVFMTGDLPTLKKHYAGLTERIGFDVRPTHSILYGMGNRQVREENPDNALALFNYLISIYPESERAHSQLADLYTQRGDTAKAEWHRDEAARLASER
jgi:predicted alpha/beta superfamily hydrolase